MNWITLNVDQQELHMLTAGLNAKIREIDRLLSIPGAPDTSAVEVLEDLKAQYKALRNHLQNKE